MQNLKFTFRGILMATAILLPAYVHCQPDSASNSNIKVNLMPSIFLISQSWHYEHQLKGNTSLHFGIYYFNYKFFTWVSFAGINANYRYYFTKSEALKGLYFGGGLNFNYDITGDGDMPTVALRPTFGYQFLGRRWLFDIGSGLNIGVVPGESGHFPFHVMLGIGYRLERIGK
jgi:hypothetical protein